MILIYCNDGEIHRVDADYFSPNAGTGLVYLKKDRDELVGAVNMDHVTLVCKEDSDMMPIGISIAEFQQRIEAAVRHSVSGGCGQCAAEQK